MEPIPLIRTKCGDDTSTSPVLKAQRHVQGASFTVHGPGKLGQLTNERPKCCLSALIRCGLPTRDGRDQTAESCSKEGCKNNCKMQLLRGGWD